MSGQEPFDPGREAPLLSAFVDGELSAAEAARVQARLDVDPQVRDEVERLRALKSLTASMRLKEPPAEEWEHFWAGHYNRAERSLGWLLVVAGGGLLAGWGLWLALGALLQAPDLPPLAKAAILIALAGVCVLGFSALRERLYVRRHTRYKDVVR